MYKSPVPTSPSTYITVTVFCAAFVAGGLAWDWDWKMVAMAAVIAVVFAGLSIWAVLDDRRMARNRAEEFKKRQREIAENRVPKSR